VEVDTLIADGGTVMVEWHGGFTAGGPTIHTKVMSVLEVDANGRIRQMRESFDGKSFTGQLRADEGTQPPRGARGSSGGNRCRQLSAEPSSGRGSLEMRFNA
jgi:hypothetical protein